METEEQKEPCTISSALQMESNKTKMNQGKGVACFLMQNYTLCCFKSVKQAKLYNSHHVFEKNDVKNEDTKRYFVYFYHIWISSLTRNVNVIKKMRY